MFYWSTGSTFLRLRTWNTSIVSFEEQKNGLVQVILHTTPMIPGRLVTQMELRIVWLSPPQPLPLSIRLYTLNGLTKLLSAKLCCQPTTYSVVSKPTQSDLPELDEQKAFLFVNFAWLPVVFMHLSSNTAGRRHSITPLGTWQKEWHTGNHAARPPIFWHFNWSCSPHRK